MCGLRICGGYTLRGGWSTIMLFKQKDETLRGVVKELAIVATIGAIGGLLAVLWIFWGILY